MKEFRVTYIQKGVVIERLVTAELLYAQDGHIVFATGNEILFIVGGRVLVSIEQLNPKLQDEDKEPAENAGDLPQSTLDEAIDTFDSMQDDLSKAPFPNQGDA